MKPSKFFDKFLDNLSKIDENNLKHIVELMESERQTFRAIVDALDEALIVVNDTRLIYINNLAKNLLQASIPTVPIQIEESKRFVHRQEIYNFLLSFNCTNQKTPEFFDAETKQYYEVEKIGVSEGFCIIKIRNINEKKSYESQLNNLESIGALNTLAAGIAHEIKNPLSAVDLHTQIIKKAIDKNIISVPDEVVEYIQIISEETASMNRILNDFLISARKHELELVFEDVNTFLDEIFDIYQPEMDRSGISLIRDYHDIQKIFIDKNYLKQAIVNLVKNAIDAVVDSELRTIRVSTFYDLGRDSVGITISDSGKGIERKS